jgi:pimeloyl-ACP methyl ester carboxylesterase
MKWSGHVHDNLTFAVAETGDGEPVLFQHGLCGDANQPAEVFSADAGWRCTTLECRGHGRSEAGSPDRFSIATFTADVCSLIEVRKLGPVVLGGISMGAAIALRLAVVRPDLVRGLILARPAWLDTLAPLNMRPNAVAGEFLSRYPVQEARARFESSETARILKAEAPDNLASLRGFFLREPIAVTRELLTRISGDGPGVDRSDIARIRVPTLVIGCGRDLVHPLSLARTLTGMIPAARMVEITAKAESPDRYRGDFHGALAAFLRDLPG